MLISLAYHANTENESFPRVDTIVKESGINEKTVRGVLRRLEGCSCVEVRPRYKQSSIYTLNPGKITAHLPVNPRAPIQVNLPGLDPGTFTAPETEPLTRKIYPSDPVSLPLSPGRFTGSLPLNRTLTVLEERSACAPDGEEKELPQWWKTLAEHPLWPKDENPSGYIEQIRSAFPTLKLEVEAVGALHWLLTNTTGQKRTDLKRTWWNWLKRDLAKQTAPPPSQLAGDARRAEILEEGRKHAGDR